MESRQHIEAAAAQWIAERDTGPWTQDRAAAFDAWLAQSVSHRAAYYRLNAAWEEVGRLKVLRDAETSAPGGRQRLHPASWRRAALAAGILLVVGVALFVGRGGDLRGSSYATAVGGLQAVPMPDGSTVTLNTDSRLRVAMNDTERHVELQQGEAFFEVAKDPGRPFVVIAGDKRIVAVGTAFSVRREADDVRVVVTEGAVRVETAGDPRSRAEPLSAGSIVRAGKDRVAVENKRPAEIEQVLSWRMGLLTFRNTPLAEAVAEFNRYNTRQIAIEDPRIAALEIGGVFRATNLEPFVGLLEQAFPVAVTMDVERITLKSR